jgi:hypothetical protein
MDELADVSIGHKVMRIRKDEQAILTKQRAAHKCSGCAGLKPIARRPVREEEWQKPRPE